MIAELITVSDAIGGRAAHLMRLALEKGHPYNGGLEESIRYFGEHWEAVMTISAPVVVALDGMVPGAQTWFEKTKFQEDKVMLEALLEMANFLNQYRRPSDARMRPDNIPPPRHL